jgi:hypothetical protein
MAEHAREERPRELRWPPRERLTRLQDHPCLRAHLARKLHDAVRLQHHEPIRRAQRTPGFGTFRHVAIEIRPDQRHDHRHLGPALLRLEHRACRLPRVQCNHEVGPRRTSDETMRTR